MPAFTKTLLRDRLLLYVVGACLIVHLISAVVSVKTHPYSISPMQDPLEYRTIALNLLEHGTFSIAPASEHNPDMLRTPLYPFFLAGTYLVDDSGFTAILLQQILLALMGVLLFLLLRHFGVSHTISLVLTALYLLEPQQWLYSLQTMTETLSSFFLLCAIAAVFLGEKIAPSRRAMVMGICVGLALLTKPTILILTPFLLALLWRIELKWKENLRIIMIALAVSVLVISPWLVRNYLLVGTPELSSSHVYNFAIAFNKSDLARTLNQGPPLVDSAGRAGQVMYGFTKEGYPAVINVAKEALANISIARLVSAQIACAPIVWFSLPAVYDNISTIAISRPIPGMQGFGYVVSWAALLLYLAGMAILVRRKMYVAATAFAGMVFATVFINICLSYSRMLLPLYPVIFVGIGIALESIFLWFRAQTSKGN